MSVPEFVPANRINFGYTSDDPTLSVRAKLTVNERIADLVSIESSELTSTAEPRFSEVERNL
jgi:hypothetical protein